MVTHGELLCTVDAPGPLLPAEAETKMPAEAAARKASWTGDVGSSAAVIEKLITSTPSLIAASIAARMSESYAPDLVASFACHKTLYAAILAAGATPEIRPKSRSSTTARTPWLPAAIEAVWLPWPSPSRGETKSARWSAGTRASQVSPK